MRHLALSLFLALTFIASPAYASPAVNDEGAKKLETLFGDILDYMKTVYGENGLGGISLFTMEGELSVTQQEGYYAITMPHMYYQEPEGVKVDFGVTAFNAIQDDRDGYWKMTIAFPEVIKVTEDNEELASINIGSQNIAALLSEKLGYFTKYDGTLENITISINDESIETFSIEKIRYFVNLEENNEGKFAGPFDVSMTGFNIIPKDEEGFLKIGKASIEGNIKGSNPVSLNEYKEKILKYTDKLQSLETVENEEDFKKIDMNPQEIADMFSELFWFDIQGIDFAYKAEDISAKIGSEDVDSLELKNALFGMSFDDLNTDSGSFSLNIAYNGAKSEPTQPEYEGIVPSDLNLHIEAKKIPVQSLTTISKNTLAAITENPDMATMAGMGLVMKLPAILSQAGTQIIIEKNHAKSALYDASISGKIIADMSAVASATGKFTGVFEGLDALYKKVEKNANDPDLPDAQNFATMLPNLMMLKNYGKAGTGPSGAPAYSYDLELTPEGKFLINGQDLSAQPAPPPAEE